jgi:hypothetical protein
MKILQLVSILEEGHEYDQSIIHLIMKILMYFFIKLIKQVLQILMILPIFEMPSLHNNKCCNYNFVSCHF